MSDNTPEIPLFRVFIPPEEELMPRLRDVLYSGQISEGEPVVQFEQDFAAFVGLPNVLSFYSGTAALHTALVLAGVKPGDEVISTPMTAEPTNMAICHAGGKIVWADVDPLSGNISPDSIAERISHSTRAVMVVHYGGIPASMLRISEIAANAGITVIEDAAHALGARCSGKVIGAWSPYAMFSLQAIKHMTTVDGGMLACANPSDLPHARRFRWFGIDRHAPRTEVDVKEIGYKYHMNNVNATIGLVQLRHAARVIGRHKANGRYYDSALAGIPGLRCCHGDPDAEPSYWLYTVLAERRDDLSHLLSEKGIGNSLAHRRNDWHSVFSSSRRRLPGLDQFYAHMLHIPCGWWVRDEDREFIANTIRSGW